jgi:hypothetical protein
MSLDRSRHCAIRVLFSALGKRAWADEPVDWLDLSALAPQHHPLQDGPTASQSVAAGGVLGKVVLEP